MIRLAVRVARAHAEAVLQELMALSPGGLEERELDADTVEYALYGAPGELPALPDLRAAAGEALVDVSTTEVPDDWDERWREWHPPVDVDARGRSVRVRPPWAQPRQGAIDIVIDPGQAFGTGQHHTTKLCLELLLALEPAGALADWGCGSGVLAVTAALLGYAPVLACDVEAASVDATRTAAARHGVDLAVTRCDLRCTPGPWAPTVTANLVLPLLLEVAERVERPPERLIASGLLHEEAGTVAAAFARHGLAERERRHAGEWAAILLHA